MAGHSGAGTREDSLSAADGAQHVRIRMFIDETSDPPSIVCQVGSTQLRNDRRAIDVLHAMLRAHGDWMPLDGADE